MTSNPRKNHIMFPSSGYYRIRNGRFASARFPEDAKKGKSAIVLLVALLLLGAVLGTISESRIMGALRSALNNPSLRAYANEQGDGSDSLIVPPESTQAGGSASSASP
jgi:hypothetical protein